MKAESGAGGSGGGALAVPAGTQVMCLFRNAIRQYHHSLLGGPTLEVLIYTSYIWGYWAIHVGV